MMNTAFNESAGSSRTINFRDVQESLYPFSGDDSYSVEKWVADVEEMPEVCGWTSLEIFIYGKCLLQGTAMLFISAECGIKSWETLRYRLRDEFRNRLTAVDVHRQLAAQTRQEGETLMQFLYRMRDLAMQGSVQDDSLIDYVISGIQDSEVNKTVLYGATNIVEFKRKLEVYGGINQRILVEAKNNIKPHGRRSEPYNQFRPSQLVDKSLLRCYTCGVKGHPSPDCPDAAKGIKCFVCQSHGHRAADCPNAGRRNEDGPQMYRVNSLPADSRIFKLVKVQGVDTAALIDTGCDMNICRRSFMMLLSQESAVSAKVRLNGPAVSSFDTEKMCAVDLSVDGNAYHIYLYSVSDDILCDLYYRETPILNEG